jgi:hypothetical protein
VFLRASSLHRVCASFETFRAWCRVQLQWLAGNAPRCEVSVLNQEIEPFDYGEHAVTYLPYHALRRPLAVSCF